MFLNFEEELKYHEILMPDLSLVTPYSSGEVQTRIQQYIQRQPKTNKFEFIVTPLADNPTIQAFAIKKRVVGFRYEEPTVIIQGYLHQIDEDQLSKIIATAKIATSYWLNSFFLIGLLLIAGALRTVSSEIPVVILFETILLIFVGVLAFQVIAMGYINRGQYINKFIDEIKQILPKEDGTFE